MAAIDCLIDDARRYAVERAYPESIEALCDAAQKEYDALAMIEKEAREYMALGLARDTADDGPLLDALVHLHELYANGVIV